MIAIVRTPNNIADATIAIPIIEPIGRTVVPVVTPPPDCLPTRFKVGRSSPNAWVGTFIFIEPEDMGGFPRTIFEFICVFSWIQDCWIVHIAQLPKLDMCCISRHEGSDQRNALYDTGAISLAYCRLIDDLDPAAGLLRRKGEREKKIEIE
jgi:hypothetical protein